MAGEQARFGEVAMLVAQFANELCQPQIDEQTQDAQLDINPNNI